MLTVVVVAVCAATQLYTVGNVGKKYIKSYTDGVFVCLSRYSTNRPKKPFQKKTKSVIYVYIYIHV